MIVYPVRGTHYPILDRPTLPNIRRRIGGRCMTVEFLHEQGGSRRVWACDEDGGLVGLPVNQSLQQANVCHLTLVGTVVELSRNEWLMFIKDESEHADDVAEESKQERSRGFSEDC